MAVVSTAQQGYESFIRLLQQSNGNGWLARRGRAGELVLFIPFSKKPQAEVAAAEFAKFGQLLVSDYRAGSGNEGSFFWKSLGYSIPSSHLRLTFTNDAQAERFLTALPQAMRKDLLRIPEMRPALEPLMESMRAGDQPLRIDQFITSATTVTRRSFVQGISALAMPRPTRMLEGAVGAAKEMPGAQRLVAMLIQHAAYDKAHGYTDYTTLFSSLNDMRHKIPTLFQGENAALTGVVYDDIRRRMFEQRSRIIPVAAQVAQVFGAPDVSDASFLKFIHSEIARLSEIVRLTAGTPQNKQKAESLEEYRTALALLGGQTVNLSDEQKVHALLESLYVYKDSIEDAMVRKAEQLADSSPQLKQLINQGYSAHIQFYDILKGYARYGDALTNQFADRLFRRLKLDKAYRVQWIADGEKAYLRKPITEAGRIYFAIEDSYEDYPRSFAQIVSETKDKVLDAKERFRSPIAALLHEDARFVLHSPHYVLVPENGEIARYNTNNTDIIEPLMQAYLRAKGVPAANISHYVRFVDPDGQSGLELNTEALEKIFPGTRAELHRLELTSRQAVERNRQVERDRRQQVGRPVPTGVVPYGQYGTGNLPDQYQHAPNGGLYYTPRDRQGRPIDPGAALRDLEVTTDPSERAAPAGVPYVTPGSTSTIDPRTGKPIEPPPRPGQLPKLPPRGGR